MNRKPHLPALALAVAALFGTWRAAVPAQAQDASKPNVLLIAVDDLNAWIGPLDRYYGVKTPNLDRLARRSVLFSRAYSAAPACNPSRAALMTGVRPATSGVYHNDQEWRPALRNAVTLSQHFRANGYQVVGGGKIFHGSQNDRASWDEYQGMRDSPHPKRLPANGIPRAKHFDWGPVDVPDERMGDWKTAQWAIRQLGQKRGEPLFLAVGFSKPHLPWYVPRRYFDMYPLDQIKLPRVDPDDLSDVPPPGVEIAKPEGDHRKVVQHDQWAQAVQGYLAAITFADANIGLVLDALDESPEARNTVVVLWGDHGWHLGEKQHWRKFTLWEEGNRTPLLIAGPGIKTGRSEKPVSLMDIYPTLIELCNLTAKDRLEGVSLAPLLRDPTARWDRPAVMTHGRGNHAVRSERWRYIRYADGSEELYDHQADPLEWKNLAGFPQHAGVKKELAKWLPATDAPDVPRSGADDD